MIRAKIIVPCSLLVLGGCTVGPDYVPPKMDVPPSYANSATGPADARPSLSRDSLAQWWTLFRDPTLDALIEQALQSNLDIRIASSRIAEARYRLLEAGSLDKPVIGAAATANNTQVSENTGLAAIANASGTGIGGSAGSGGRSTGSGFASPGRNFSTFSAGFDASWEIDLFGGARRSREAARADLDASIWSRRDTQVTLSAEVARVYFLLRRTQAQLSQADALIAARKGVVEQTQAKTTSGIVPGRALSGPTALLKQAEAERAQLEETRSDQLAALAVLLAVSQSNLPTSLVAARSPDSPTTLDIPAGLPSELLRRRPDIRASERQLAAATARIGVAKADLYPRLSLTGVAELISTALGNLVSSGSIQTLAQGQFSFPLLDFGRGKAKVGIASEQAEQAYLSYRKTVLTALADVERELGAVQAQRARDLALRGNLRQAEKAESAALASFHAGLTDLTSVEQAKESRIAAQLTLLESDFALKQAEIGLFKALGGGWPTETAQDAPAGDPKPG